MSFPCQKRMQPLHAWQSRCILDAGQMNSLDQALGLSQIEVIGNKQHSTNIGSMRTPKRDDVSVIPNPPQA